MIQATGAYHTYDHPPQQPPSSAPAASTSQKLPPKRPVQPPPISIKPSESSIIQNRTLVPISTKPKHAILCDDQDHRTVASSHDNDSLTFSEKGSIELSPFPESTFITRSSYK